MMSLLATLLVVVPAAQASKQVSSTFGASGTGNGELQGAGPIAVNQATGDVYVIDVGGLRVQRFDANGVYDLQFPVTGTAGIAIDQADGSVYVSDATNNVVQKFNADGSSPSVVGTSCAGSPCGNGELSAPSGLAVDPSSGDLYVADTNDNRVVRFDDNGTFERNFATGNGLGDLSSPSAVAVDAPGNVYVLDPNAGRILKTTTTGAYQGAIAAGQFVFPGPMTIDPASGDILLFAYAPDFSSNGVFEFDASGTFVDEHAAPAGLGGSGLGIRASTGRLYVSSGDTVAIVENVTPPTATVAVPTAITASGATLHGTVNAHGGPSVTWRFETSPDAGTTWTPTADGPAAVTGSSDTPISLDVSGLSPNTSYSVRLVATPALNPPVTSNETPLTTVQAPPIVVTGTATVDTSTATLHGTVNPNNLPTTYWFEYGTTTAYGDSAPATQDADAGSGAAPVDVSRAIGGLTRGTIYHYRLVAHNAAGTTTGPDAKLGTPVAGSGEAFGLPDDRVYEKVSPDDKNGADVMGDPLKTRAAIAGDAVTFASLSGFGDGQGAGLSFEYMGVRTVQGWSTHSLMPSQDPGDATTAANPVPPMYLGEFSSDLSHGIFRALSPLTDTPNVANTHNLYLRSDLRLGGVGAYDLITASETPVPPYGRGSVNFVGYTPFFAGASADWRHVFFQSSLNLTSAATGTDNKLYEWVDGTVRLAGILPNGQPATCANGDVCSIAGRGAGGPQRSYTSSAISADGSRVVFTSPSDIGGNVTDDSQLYMRVDGLHTLHLNASERTTSDMPQRATFWGGSADLTKVFFTTTEQLTDDDTNSSLDLYQYDTSKADADPHNLTRLSSGVGVIGVSADGGYVYFTARGQLVNGAPTFAQDGTRAGIYVYRGGNIRYIGNVDTGDEDLLLSIAGYTLNPSLARLTPDGRRLLFAASDGDGLTGYEHATHCSLGVICREVYLYDAAANNGAGRLVCASCRPDGARASESAEFLQRIGVGNSSTTSHLNRALTSDGKRAFFMTREHLVPEDDNGNVQDIYEYDVDDGRLHLLTRGASDAYFLDASASGDDVFFVTRDQLVARDVDQSFDLYDARVDGSASFGAASATAPRCSGDVCQGQPATKPSAGSAANDRATGPGDPAVPPRPHARASALSATGRRNLARRGKATLTVKTTTAGKVSIVAKATMAGHATTVAKASKVAKRAATVHIPLVLTKSARSALVHSHKLRLTLTITFTGERQHQTMNINLTTGR